MAALTTYVALGQERLPGWLAAAAAFVGLEGFLPSQPASFTLLCSRWKKGEALLARRCMARSGRALIS